MKKCTIRRFVHDSSVGSRFYGDEILNAIPPGKVVCLGTVWAGDLKPFVDAMAEAIESSYIAPGLSLNHVLHAEQIGHVTDLGRQYLGTLERKLLNAADGGQDSRVRVDIGEVIEAGQRLQRQMGTDRQAIADGVRRLRAAADKVSDSLKGPHTNDSRDVLAGINRANREAAARRATPQVDSSGRMNWHPDSTSTARTTAAAVRDTANAAAAAGTMHDRLAGLNRAARQFWAGR